MIRTSLKLVRFSFCNSKRFGTIKSVGCFVICQKHANLEKRKIYLQHSFDKSSFEIRKTPEIILATTFLASLARLRLFCKHYKLQFRPIVLVWDHLKYCSSLRLLRPSVHFHSNGLKNDSRWKFEPNCCAYNSLWICSPISKFVTLTLFSERILVDYNDGGCTL